MSKENSRQQDGSRPTFKEWMGMQTDVSASSIYESNRSKAAAAIDVILESDEKEGSPIDVSIAAYGVSQLAYADFLLKKQDSVYTLGTVLEELSDEHNEAYKSDVFSLYFDASALGQEDAQKRVWSLLSREKRDARKDIAGGHIVFYEDFFPLVEDGVVKHIDMGKDADEFIGEHAVDADHAASLKLKYYEESTNADESVKDIARRYRDDVTEYFLESELLSPHAAMGIAARLYDVQDDPEKKQMIFTKFDQVAREVSMDKDSYVSLVWFASTLLKDDLRVHASVKENFERNVTRGLEILKEDGEDAIEIGKIAADFQVAAAYYDHKDPRTVATTLHAVYQNLYEESSSEVYGGISEKEETNDAWENALGNWASFYAEKRDFEGANVFLSAMGDDMLRAEKVESLLVLTQSSSEVDALRPRAGEDLTQIPATDNVFTIYDSVADVRKAKELTDAIKMPGKPIKDRMRYGRQLLKQGIEGAVDRYVDGLDHPILALERAKEQVRMGDIRGLSTMQRVVEELQDPNERLEWHATIVVLAAQEMTRNAA